MTGRVGALQVGDQGGLVALAGFAEEPADGFVNEVVGVVKEDIGDGESIGQLSVADEGHGADDAYALLPQGFAVAGEVVEQAAVFIQQPFAQQGIAREVYQVPVIDILGVGEVEIDAVFGDFSTAVEMTICVSFEVTIFVILRSVAT